MRTSKALFVFVFLLGGYAHAQAHELNFSINPGLSTEMTKFNSHGQKLDPEFIYRITKTLHEKIVSEAQFELDSDQSGKCTPYVNVSFLNASSPELSAQGKLPNDAESDFESGLVKVDAQGCMAAITPNLVIEEFVKPAFRVEALGGQLKNSDIENNLLCDETKRIPALIAPTKSCYAIERQASSTTSYSALVSLSQNIDGYDPFYYREGYVGANTIDGETHVHMIIYLREQKMTGLMRMAAKSKLTSIELSVFQHLADALKH
jgi:hypothetical protein